MKPLLLLTMGDPLGVGPEVVLKAAASPDVRRAARIVLVGSAAWMLLTQPPPRAPRLVAIGSLDEADRVSDRDLPVLDCAPEAHGPAPVAPTRLGEISREAGEVSWLAVKRAAELCLAGEAGGMVTAPVSKEAWSLAGVTHPGHTGYLREVSGAPEAVMMLAHEKFRVALVTEHVALRDVPDRVTRDGVVSTVRVTDEALRRDFGIAEPRIACCGLNPHAGEGGILGTEERDVVIPALEAARADGHRVEGPFPADSLFPRRGEYDAVVALYHDQGLVPLKMAGFGGAVNVTLGLPFVRTSVDHGTAFDIAGRGVAKESSLIEAIRMAAAMTGRRSRA
jgi:4-hydroxythreonine-4-phosphate dehydrogenase